MNNHFLIYAYCRDDGTFYYIGKGTARRPYQKNGRAIKPPKNKNNIIILHKNLDENTALEYEINLIKFYGRKDIGEGLLWNMTNGGEGVSGWVPNKEWRIKKSLSMKGKNNSFYGKKHTEDTKKLISIANTGKLSGEKCYFYNKKYFGETNPMWGKKRPDLSKRNKEISVSKGTIWYNNGNIEIRCNVGEQPENFVAGRLKRNWYTDGLINVLCIPEKVPKNFFPGRTIKSLN